MTEFLWVLGGLLVVVLLSYLVYSVVKTSRTRQRGDVRGGGAGFVGGGEGGDGGSGGGGNGGGGGGNGGG